MGAAAYLAIVVLNTSLEQVIVIGVILQRTVKGFGRLQAFLQQDMHEPAGLAPSFAQLAHLVAH